MDDLDGHLSNVQLAQLGNKIQSLIRLNKKVVLITHGPGTHIFNTLFLLIPNLYQLREAPYKKYFAHIQTGYSPTFSHAILNRSYTISKFGDMFEFGNIANPTHTLLQRQTIDVFNENFARTYLSPYVTLQRNFSPVDRNMVDKADKMFLEQLEEVAWMLANNDNECCEGRDGRFHLNKQPNDKHLAGGFAEFSVTKSKDNILIDKTSQVCGKVTLTSSDSNKIEIIEGSKILGENQITLSGNVQIDNSEIKNIFPSKALTISNDNSSYPLIFNNTDILNSIPSISGPIIFHDTSFEYDPIITGETFTAPTGETYQPSINDSIISGNSDLSGFYIISNRNMVNSAIHGTIGEKENGEWNFLAVDPSATDFLGITASGFGYIAGIVKGYATIEGSKIIYNNQENLIGINIHHSATLNGGEMHGAVLIDTNAISKDSEWFCSTIKNDGGICHASGDTLIDTLTLSGAPRIVTSTFNYGTISGTPYISNSHFHSAVTISCDANVIGRNDDDGFEFGCGYPNKNQTYKNNFAKTMEEINSRKLELLEQNLLMQESSRLKSQKLL